MEKSLEQLKHIERISRQTRRYRAHLNQVCDQNLHKKINNLADERDHTILRSAARRRIEEQRKEVIGLTIKQITRERQQEPLRVNTTQIEQETIEKFPEDNDSRPSSSIKMPCAGKSCRLFSHNCQLYPCQPVYQYTSFQTPTHDRTIGKRVSSRENSTKGSDVPHLQKLFTTIQEKKHYQHRRQLAVAIQNQHHLVHRHESVQRTVTRLDEQSRLLHEQLANKRTFGYNRERQHQLSLAIQTHLNVTAKFCA